MDNEPSYQGHIVNVFDDSREILEVRIFDSQSQSNRRQLVCLTRSTNDGGDWATVGLMCPDDARSLALHLLNAAEIANMVEEQPHAGIIGVRCLPTITLCGNQFFIDERLRQLRNAENPMHFFDLDDPMR